MKWIKYTKSYKNAAKIHQIPEDMVFRGGYEASRAVMQVELIREVNGNPPLAASPAHFDYGFLKRLYGMTQFEMKWSHRVMDLPTLATFVLGIEKPKLIKVADHLKCVPDHYKNPDGTINPNAPHNAAEDSFMTALCFYRINKILKAREEVFKEGVELDIQMAKEARSSQ